MVVLNIRNGILANGSPDWSLGYQCSYIVHTYNISTCIKRWPHHFVKLKISGLISSGTSKGLTLIASSFHFILFLYSIHYESRLMYLTDVKPGDFITFYVCVSLTWVL